MMFTLVAGGWGFVALYLSGRFLRSVPLNISKSMAPWLAIHGTLALVALLGSSVLLLTRTTDEEQTAGCSGFKSKLNAHHRLCGTVIALLWLFTHIGGVVNLYILK